MQGPKRGIPRYMPQIHHVLCLFYAVTNACFVPINWVLGIVPPCPRRPRLPPAARLAPFVPPLSLFFYIREWSLFAQNIFKIFTAYTVVSAADVVLAAIAQDEAGHDEDAHPLPQ